MDDIKTLIKFDPTQASLLLDDIVDDIRIRESKKAETFKKNLIELQPIQSKKPKKQIQNEMKKEMKNEIKNEANNNNNKKNNTINENVKVSLFKNQVLIELPDSDDE